MPRRLLLSSCCLNAYAEYRSRPHTRACASPPRCPTTPVPPRQVLARPRGQTPVHGQRRERTRLITGPIVLEKGERSRHLHIAGEQQEGPARTAIARHGVGSHTSAPVRSPRTAGEPRPALNDREAECLPAANV